MDNLQIMIHLLVWSIVIKLSHTTIRILLQAKEYVLINVQVKAMVIIQLKNVCIKTLIYHRLVQALITQIEFQDNALNFALKELMLILIQNTVN
jgi:hypothetical protein